MPEVYEKDGSQTDPPYRSTKPEYGYIYNGNGNDKIRKPFKQRTTFGKFIQVQNQVDNELLSLKTFPKRQC